MRLRLVVDVWAFLRFAAILAVAAVFVWAILAGVHERAACRARGGVPHDGICFAREVTR